VQSPEVRYLRESAVRYLREPDGYRLGTNRVRATITVLAPGSQKMPICS
jgi:hypothetical protein